jgi:hypothetical protein
MILIASIIFVVAVVGLIAVIEALVHAPFHTGITKPQVTLSVLTVNNSGAVIAVGGISSATNPSNLKVNLLLNGTPGTSVSMPTANNGTVRIVSDKINCTVRWTDADGDGLLGSGDYFTVSRPGGLPHPGVYTFYLLWVDGTLIASADFQTH